jgi:hypothetical protein
MKMKKLWYAILLNLAILPSVFAEVRVEIIRELPNEKQTVVQMFNDEEEFRMWMSMKMEESCDVYVTGMKVDLEYNPNDGAGTYGLSKNM